MGVASLNNRLTPKEKGLVKGALRRIFSRSDLRKQAIEKQKIKHHDPNRPRVTKWLWCPECGVIYPAYQAQVDHQVPIVGTNETLDDLTLDDLVDRIWCDISNLRAMDKDCHKIKSAAENKLRRAYKKAKREKTATK